MQRKISKRIRVMENEVKAFREMINSLYIDALKNGMISGDEKALINQIELGFKEFSKTVGDALEDGIFSAEEENQLVLMQAKMMKSVTDTAAADNIISDDEKAILRKITNYFIHQMERIDHTSRKE